jgi:hypothetical protein
MLSFLHGRKSRDAVVGRAPVNAERFRLFALACCRRLWSLLEYGNQYAVQCLETYAREGMREALLKARRFQRPASNAAGAAMTASHGADRKAQLTAWARNLASSVVWTASRNPPSKAAMAYQEAAQAVGSVEAAAELVPGQSAPLPNWRRFSSAELAAQCDLLRDVFGNPFRPVTFDPAWRTPTVVALARQMDEAPDDRRDYAALPILADALQDAGCDSADLLDHCRGKGPHVRGCWALDLVLGKP